MNKDFIIGDVLSFGWRVMKENLGFFAGLMIVAGGISMIPQILEQLLVHMPLPQGVIGVLYFLLWVADQLIGVMIGIGFTKIALSFCGQIKPDFNMLFDAWDCFWRYVGAGVLYGLIVFGGLVLLIIPGIIWSIKFGLCFYFVIDKGLKPIEALKASSRTTQDIKLKLFGFGLLCGLINLLGLICLIVGIFATYPTVLIASALVYRHLMVQTPELAEFGIGLAPAEIEPIEQQDELFEPE